MEFKAENQDIIRLLTKLKDVQGEYPENMLVVQRQRFLKQITEIELGVHGAKAGSNSAKSTKSSSMASSTTSTFLEVALLVTVLAEISLMAYFYRDKVAEFLQTFTTGPRVEEGTAPPFLPTSSELQGVSPSSATSVTTVAAQPTTITSIPEILSNSKTPGTPPPTPGISSTSDPNGNNGHHYGQTPKPERTKENNGNKDKPPKDKEDKPPKEKDDKPSEGNHDKPAEEKPPKEK